MRDRDWEDVALRQPHSRVLQRSRNFTVVARFESVFLLGGGLVGFAPAGLAIGDFYGEPVAAAIDEQELWCVVVGCGLVAYRLRPPWDPYPCRPSAAEHQWWEYGRVGASVWLDSVEAVGEGAFSVAGEGGTLYVDCEGRAVTTRSPT